MLKVTKGLPTVDLPINKLLWMLDGITELDEERVSKVDLNYPVIVQELARGKGRFVTLDGFHRVVRAASEGHMTIKAIVVNDALITKLTHQTLSNEGFITIDEARAAAQSKCDAEGIDPTLSNAERCGRLIDIQQGSPLMQEERDRKAAYVATPSWDRFKAHVDSVIKTMPPTISERQAADKFHRDLKAKLNQVDRVPYMEKINSKNLFSLSVSKEFFGGFSSKPKLKVNKETISILQDTFLNSNWLDKQKLVTGTIKLSESDYGTFVVDDPVRNFDTMRQTYMAYCNEQIAKLTAFEKQIAPLKSFAASNPKATNNKLVSQAEQVQLKKAGSFIWPNKNVSVETLDANGLKHAAQLAIKILRDNTVFPNFHSRMNKLYTEWDAYADRAEHESDVYMVAQAVKGQLESFVEDVDSEELDEGWSLNKANFLRNLFELMNKSIK